jgi:hypothetical protein
MMPDPLHPAVVHLPIALAVLLPALALGAALAIRAGWLPVRTWVVVVLLQLALFGSGWLALKTGEEQEERVEDVVSERRIEAHEEAAERFVTLAAGAALVSAAGLLGGGLGRLGRAATVIAAGAVLAAGVATGHSGGELVYRYGAADAYVRKAERRVDAGATRTTPSPARREHRDDD